MGNKKKKGKRNYIEEACVKCYYWDSVNEVCLKDGTCLFYSEESHNKKLKKELKKAVEDMPEHALCEGCPYGSYAPCIGFCMKLILEGDA